MPDSVYDETAYEDEQNLEDDPGPGFMRSLGKRPRIAIVTNAVTFPYSERKLHTWTRYNEFFANKDCYARRHGYDLIVDYRNHVDGMGFYVDPATGERGPTNVHFNKPWLLRKWLPHYDWVLWLDLDTLVLDMERPIETFIDALGPENHILLPQEQMSVYFFSAYALLLRNSPEALAMVDDWFSLKDCCPHALYDDQARLYAAVLRMQIKARGAEVDRSKPATTDCLDLCEKVETQRDFSWCFDRAVKANGYSRMPAPQRGPVAFSALPTERFTRGNDTGLALQGMFGGVRDRLDLLHHAFALHTKPYCVRDGEKFCSPFVDALFEPRYRRGMRECYGDGWAADALPALADPPTDPGAPARPDIGPAADWEAAAVSLIAAGAAAAAEVAGEIAAAATAAAAAATAVAAKEGGIAGAGNVAAEVAATAEAAEDAAFEFAVAEKARILMDSMPEPVVEQAATAVAGGEPIPALNPRLGVPFSELRGKTTKMRQFGIGGDDGSCFAALPSSGAAPFASDVIVPVLRAYLCHNARDCGNGPPPPRPPEEVAAAAAANTSLTLAEAEAAAAAAAEASSTAGEGAAGGGVAKRDVTLPLPAGDDAPIESAADPVLAEAGGDGAVRGAEPPAEDAAAAAAAGVRRERRRLAQGRDAAWPLSIEVTEDHRALSCTTRLAGAVFPSTLLVGYREDFRHRPWHFTFLRDPVDRLLISYLKTKAAATWGSNHLAAACTDTAFTQYAGNPPPVLGKDMTLREFADIPGQDEIVTKFYTGVGWNRGALNAECTGYGEPKLYPRGNYQSYAHYQANGAVGKLLEYEYLGLFEQWERSIKLLHATLSGGGASPLPRASYPPPPSAANNLNSELQNSAAAIAEFARLRLDPEVRAYIQAKNPIDTLVYARAVEEFERRCRHFGV